MGLGMLRSFIIYICVYGLIMFNMVYNVLYGLYMFIFVYMSFMVDMVVMLFYAVFWGGKDRYRYV